MLFDFRNIVSLQTNRTVAIATLVAVGPTLLASGCALTPSPTKAISKLSEAKARKEVARLAKNDPFPSVAEVGH